MDLEDIVENLENRHPGERDKTLNLVAEGVIKLAEGGLRPEWIQNYWTFNSGESDGATSPFGGFSIRGPILRMEFWDGNVNEVYVDFNLDIPLQAQRSGMVRAVFTNSSGLPYDLNPYGIYGAVSVEAATVTVKASTSGHFRHDSGTIIIGFDALAEGLHLVTVHGRAHYVGIPG